CGHNRAGRPGRGRSLVIRSTNGKKSGTPKDPALKDSLVRHCPTGAFLVGVKEEESDRLSGGRVVDGQIETVGGSRFRVVQEIFLHGDSHGEPPGEEVL